jgi:hypothetical protein
VEQNIAMRWKMGGIRLELKYVEIGRESRISVRF